jgi:hypothetical protein
MAKRINLQQLPYVREKIRVSQLINRLIKHVNGELELSRTQIRAAEILLKKTLPDLQAVQHSGEVMDLLRSVEVPRKSPSASQWLLEQAPPLANMPAASDKVS